jgi:hypothetical protein
MLVVVALGPRRVRWRTIFKCGTLVAPRGQGALCQPRVHSLDTSLGQQHATRIMKVCHGCQGLVGRSSAASQHKHRFVFGPPGAAVGGTPPAACLSGRLALGRLAPRLANRAPEISVAAPRLQRSPPLHRTRLGPTAIVACRLPAERAAGSVCRIRDKALARVPSSISTHHRAIVRPRSHPRTAACA